MKALLFICILLLLTAHCSERPSGVTLDKVEIYSVSTRIDRLNHSPRGSLFGGTYLYIKVTGIDQTASNNLISIGPYDCPIPEKGVNEAGLQCQTIEPWDRNRLSSLPVVVQVSGKEPSICKAGDCRFSYSYEYTPMFNFVYPNAAPASSLVTLQGLWRVGNTNEFDKLSIGGFNCGRFTINEVQRRDNREAHANATSEDGALNLNDDEEISSSKKDQNLVCRTANDTEAGIFNMTIQNTYGYPFSKYNSYNLLADGSDIYQFMTLPAIEGISSHEGSDSGQTLTIDGVGFGQDPQATSVSAAGLNCRITDINNAKITCEVAAGSATDSVSTSSHSGWRYTYYDLQGVGGDAASLRSNLRSNSSVYDHLIKQQGTMNTVSFEYESDYEGLWIRGYFKAPRTGTYNFYIAQDDWAEVWVNTQSSTINQTEQVQVLSKCGWDNRLDFFQYEHTCDQIKSTDLTFTAGEHYWVEIYQRNGGSGGHVALGVEAPEINGAEQYNSMYEIQQLNITYNPTPEKWTLKVWDTEEKFSIQFKYYDRQSRRYTWDRTTAARTWSQFTQSRIESDIDWASNYYRPSVVVHDLDASGNRCTGCTAAGREWEISFQRFRPEGRFRADPVIKNAPNGKHSESKLQDPSDPVRGTYNLWYNNIPIEIWSGGQWTADINYNTGGSSIAYGIAKINQDWDVYGYTRERADDGYQHFIYFKGPAMKGSQPLITTTSAMTGGTGSSPRVEVTVYNAASNKTFYEPVPSDMMFYPETTPQVIVSSRGGIVGVCDGNCNYTTAAAPVVVSFTRSNATITLEFASNAGFTNENMEITYAGSPCTSIDASDNTNITCQLPTNPDFTPIIEAGSHVPRVQKIGFGYADMSAATAENITVTVTGVTPATSSFNGGIEVTINGTGFAVNKDRFASNNGTVTIGSATVARIISMTNVQMNVIVPAMTSPDTADTPVKVQVNYNSESSATDQDAQNFTYVTAGVPTITSINPTTASPVIKQTISVVGTSFGTNTSELQVVLTSNGATVYDLNVLNCNDTVITAQLSGGHVGNFNLSVIKQGIGMSANSTTFSYIVVLSSLTPTSGSKLGGTVLTLTGENFSNEPLDNNVFLNFADTNTRCNVLTASSTQLTCRTPVMDPAFDGQTLNVIVAAKLIEESTCMGTCQYSYTTANTPTIGNYSKQWIWAGQTGLQINGTGFSSGTGAEIHVNDGTIVPVTINSNTQIEFTAPALPRGDYLFIVSVTGKGYAGGFDIAQIFTIRSVTPSTISRGGENIVIVGSGFTPGNDKVEINGEECEINSINASTIECKAPRLNQNTQKAVKVINKDDSDDEAERDNALTYASASTSTATRSPDAVDTPASFVITVSGSDLDTKTIDSVYLQLQSDFRRKETGAWAGSAGSYTATFTDVPAGEYDIFVHVQGEGYAYIQNRQVVVNFTSSVTATQITSSYAGGSVLTVAGGGFDTTNFDNNKVTVCNQPCKVLNTTTASSLKCAAPQLQSELISTTYNVETKARPLTASEITWEGTRADRGYRVIDNRRTTYYEADGGSEQCWLGFDLGPLSKVQISKIEYSMPIQHTSNAPYRGMLFQATNDDFWNGTVTNLTTIGAEMHLGKNIFKPDANITTAFRRVRFISQNPNNNYECKLAEFQVFGRVQLDPFPSSITSLTCNATVQVNEFERELADAVQYLSSSTPTVSSVYPMYGWQLGGDDITITGTDFGTTPSDVSVILDGISCNVTGVNDTSINCTTGNKGASNLAPRSMEVSISNNAAMVADGVEFYYGLLWSNDLSWGGDAPPRSRDTVFVPEGQTLIVDRSSPQFLELVLVEGTMIFADGTDMTFDAEYILVRNGRLIIGTEANPYESKLVITLYGTLFGKQLPEFGNKVIGCHHCLLDIHGSPKTPTWTTLNATVDINATSLVTNEATNWAVGDHLVISSMDFDHHHAEEVVITDINGTAITFEPRLNFTHYSAIEDYSGVSFPYLAEVGCLTRNILIRGDPRDSARDKYGAHLMVHGKANEGSQARLSYVEFFETGQPKIIGRYTIHFHMNGDVSNSYVLGCAVHDSFARVVALHAISYLTVRWNVGYKAAGHNIFLEDGIETHNVIEYNLIVSARKVSNMLQTDMTAACIWVTHPTNFIRYNHFAGSDFYGMWVEIKEHPDGPSATSDICPMGMPIGNYDHNVAHSNVRFGLRFFILIPREHPCEEPYGTGVDPFSENPSIHQSYTNFTGWKNGESGVLAEEMGNALFTDFKIADSHRANFHLHLTNYTREFTVLQNSLLVGRSQGNAETVRYHADAKTQGILLPRSNGFRTDNVHFYNYDPGMYLLGSSSENHDKKMFLSGAQEHYFNNTQKTNCTSAWTVKWWGPRFNYFHDVDGTLTGTNIPTWAGPYHRHYEQAVTDGHCVKHMNETWDNSVTCSKPIRGYVFRNYIPQEQFEFQEMKVLNLNEPGVQIGVNETESAYAGSMWLDIMNHKKDAKGGIAMTFIVGYLYNMHWGTGIDWDHLMIVPTIYAQPTDESIIIRYNHTEVRELYEINKMMGGQIDEGADGFYPIAGSVDRFINSTTGYPISGPDACQMGENFQDINNKQFYVCLNAKGRITEYENIDMNGIYCRDTCPSQGFDCTKETGIVRKFAPPAGDTYENQWNNPDDLFMLVKLPTEETWRKGVPQEGDDVLIPCEWTMIFNVASFTFGTLYIDGTLKFDGSFAEQTIKATNIWIRGGVLSAGTENLPHTGKINIILSGGISSPQLLIDDLSDSGTMTLAVTGKLVLHSATVPNTHNRLQANVYPGDTVLNLTNVTGWAVGDELAIAPTEKDGMLYEKVNITAVNQTTNQVTISPAIQHFHYGDNELTVGPGGKVEAGANYLQNGLDMRAVVAHLTRNIKIIGESTENLGAHVQVYHYILKNDDVDISARGYAYMQGVEFVNAGQHDSVNAGVQVILTNTPNDGKITTVKNSVFNHCNGQCMNGLDAHHVLVENTIFFDARRYGLRAENVKHWTVKNNFFIGVRARQAGAELEALTLFMYFLNMHPNADQVSVTGNVGQGSQGSGFAFPNTLCDEEYTFKDNVCGSTKEIGVFFNGKDNNCFKSGYIGVYHAGVKGVYVQAGSTSEGLTGEHMILVENGINLVVRKGTSNFIHNTVWVNDIFDSPLVREDCPDCYPANESSKCSGNFGMQMGVSTMACETFPIKPTGTTNFDVICNPPATFGTLLFRNSVFHNFRQTYNNTPNCGNNHALKAHPSAASSSLGHHFRGVSCTNCDGASFIELQNPKTQWFSWFGGCGDVLTCTGLQNVLVQDYTGDFLGSPGSIIPLGNNHIGPTLSECTSSPPQNVYICNRTDFGVMEWDARSADRKSLSSAPAYINNRIFNNRVNMWREWEWNGAEPMNMRQNSYVSLVLLNTVNNVTFEGTKPFSMVHRIQHRIEGGERNKYIIYQYRYNTPLGIQVAIESRTSSDDRIVKTFSFSNPQDLTTHTTTCGANNYKYETREIEFVVNGEFGCDVIVRLVNQIQVQLRLAMTAADFYGDDQGQTNFIDRISAFLGISMDRVKIVGIREETSRRRVLQNQTSLVIDTAIDDEPMTANYSAADRFVAMRQMASDLKNEIVNNGMDIGFQAPVLGVETQLAVSPGANSTNRDQLFTEADLNASQGLSVSDDDDGPKHIWAAIVFPLLFVAGLVVVGILYKKKLDAKKAEEAKVAPEFPEGDEKKPQYNQVQDPPLPNDHNEVGS